MFTSFIFIEAVTSAKAPVSLSCHSSSETPFVFMTTNIGYNIINNNKTKK